MESHEVTAKLVTGVRHDVDCDLFARGGGHRRHDGDGDDEMLLLCAVGCSAKVL